jgi:hypothetical protein
MHIISVRILCISYTDRMCHSQIMKRPQRIELEFVILLFVVGGGMVYSLFRGVFALLS